MSLYRRHSRGKGSNNRSLGTNKELADSKMVSAAVSSNAEAGNSFARLKIPRTSHSLQLLLMIISSARWTFKDRSDLPSSFKPRKYHGEIHVKRPRITTNVLRILAFIFL
jgi:hypothetical protein